VQASHGVSTIFDDPNLIGSAGLIPVMRLAERAGLHDLLHEHLTVPSPNAPVKAASVLNCSSDSPWRASAAVFPQPSPME